MRSSAIQNSSIDNEWINTNPQSDGMAQCNVLVLISVAHNCGTFALIASTWLLPGNQVNYIPYSILWPQTGITAHFRWNCLINSGSRMYRAGTQVQSIPFPVNQVLGATTHLACVHNVSDCMGWWPNNYVWGDRATGVGWARGLHRIGFTCNKWNVGKIFKYLGRSEQWATNIVRG